MFEASIKQTEPMVAAYITVRGPYAQIPQAMGRLYGWVQDHGLEPKGMPESVYFTSPGQVPESEAVWEVWAPVVAGDGDLSPDESGIGIKRVDGTLVASTMYIGPYDGIGQTYQALGEWLFGQGYDIVGPPRELYYSDPAEVPPEQYVTEVQFPVRKRTTS